MEEIITRCQKDWKTVDREAIMARIKRSLVYDLASNNGRIVALMGRSKSNDS